MSHRKLAIVIALVTGALLVVMGAVSIATGVTQEAHEHFADPAAFGANLLENGGALRVVMALDVAFLCLYTAFFAVFATYLRARGAAAVLVWLALGAMVTTALLDIVEDHHILTMLDAAEHGVLPTAGAIAFQSVESATKFSVSFLSLVMFGLAIPRDTKLGVVLALYLTAGTLLAAIAGYALPPASAAAVETGRWAGFLVGFGLAVEWLRGQPEPT